MERIDILGFSADELSIEKLEELFGSLVIKSAQIETPFKDSLQDQIQALLSEIESDDMNNSKLRRFIVQNIRNISPDLYFEAKSSNV